MWVSFDVYLMKDPAMRLGEGCEFVKFVYKEALLATKQWHNIVTFPDALRLLELRRIAAVKRSAWIATAARSTQQYRGFQQQQSLQSLQIHQRSRLVQQSYDASP